MTSKSELEYHLMSDISTQKDLTADQLQRRQRVFEICDSLFVKGEKTSVRNVLSMMPDVKSTSTINVDVREWNTQAKNKRMDLFRERGFSDEFVELFSTEITRLSAAKDAEHNAEVLMYKDEADLANELLLKTEGELELAGVKLEESNTTISLKDKEITKLKTELAQTEKNCEGIEKRLSNEIDDLQDKLSIQKVDLDKAQSELAKTEVKLENQETLISNLETQLNECRNKISELSDTVTQKSGEIIRFETQAQGDIQLIKELRESRNKFSNDLAEVEAEYITTKSENARLSSELEQATIRFGTASERLTSLSDQFTELRMSNSQNISTIERQGAFSSRLEDDVKRLTQKNESQKEELANNQTIIKELEAKNLQLGNN
ncbi:KfrA N-terminal DNA-binding domain-containing protein [Vibrio crassostreae]|uniref:hypothetical protein n=1 Tax=Vibrio crassostreae TaxID=246167 RepID=UPI0010431CA5|nr:hypothetical protein [Vibrio crassostreae]CAK2342767.1 KfrA N-terminal DNA-binding domain-containing protein [Vibrio crassostreae]CAK2813765.1 KfrA N-terminal DNA-binding domain-containing protein [Vibrio crassostreae]CAK2897745.1 KfrA N-terminal DNA-binding domain-containing protein [Vibrio crassostreae]CAK3563663.1 KfrA N-terminal DNA-binding domain-containing protein [Vibrio crassostreae]